MTTDAGVHDTEAVVDYIRQLRGIDKVDLLGWSWGGRISALYTARHPDRVRRLVLYAGGAGSVPAGNRPVPADPWTVISRENIIARVEQNDAVPDAQEAFIKAALEFDVKSPSAARQRPDALPEPEPAAPEDISVPTHIFYGVRDAGWQPENVSSFFARINTTDKALTVFPNAGHFIFIQKPYKRFHAAIEHRMLQCALSSAYSSEADIWYTMVPPSAC